jgi:hypothetical protein
MSVVSNALTVAETGGGLSRRLIGPGTDDRQLEPAAVVRLVTEGRP